MKAVRDGSRVCIHLVGRLSDRSVFVSTYGDEPLDLEIGDGSLIPGIEMAMMGMKVGEKRKITLEPHDAYGRRDERLIFQVPRGQVESDVVVGDEVIYKAEEEEVPLRVIAMETDKVTLDGNHKLAGHTVSFEIELLSLNEAAAI